MCCAEPKEPAALLYATGKYRLTAKGKAALEAKIRLLNEKMDELATDLKAGSLGDLSGLSPEEIASRIENFLKKRQ